MMCSTKSTIHENSGKMVDIPILTHLFELRKIKKEFIEKTNDDQVTSKGKLPDADIGDSLNQLIHITRRHTTHLLMGEKHPIVIALRKDNHLAHLKCKILGILNYLGKCLQKSSKVSSINNPMISGNIYLHVLIR